jgi:hypothetical protein
LPGNADGLALRESFGDRNVMDLSLTRTKSAAGTALMSLNYHELVQDGRGIDL